MLELTTLQMGCLFIKHLHLRQKSADFSAFFENPLKYEPFAQARCEHRNER